MTTTAAMNGAQNGASTTSPATPAVEVVAYRGRLALAIEAARADLAERTAGSATAAGRIVVPDDVEDRLVAGDAVARELQAITRDRLAQGLSPLPALVEDGLRVRALHDALGRVGALEPFLTDDRVEEVVVNASGEAWVWWADGSKSFEGRVFDTDAEVIALAQRVVRQHGHGGQRLDPTTPFVRVDLPGGDRFVAVLGGEGRAGVATGPLISLRRKRLTRPRLDDLVARLMLPAGAAVQATVLVQAGAGMVVAGPMGSGKTTLLAAMLADRHPGERVATFERDVRELNLGAPGCDVVEFFTRAANTEGVGEVELGELIARARQLRIDRNVVGELVHGPDAWEMLNASSGATFRSVATLHADDPAIVLDRLAIYCAAHPTRPPLDQINRFIAQTVDVIWFCEIVTVADVRVRRVTSIREVGGLTDAGTVASSEVWAYDADVDRLVQQRAWSPGLLDRVRRRNGDLSVLQPERTAR